jgi:hypothetical protein
VRLWGIATASDGRNLPDRGPESELDGEAVGAGRELCATLSGWEGEHICRLRASDGDTSRRELCGVHIDPERPIAATGSSRLSPRDQLHPDRTQDGAERVRRLRRVAQALTGLATRPVFAMSLHATASR